MFQKRLVEIFTLVFYWLVAMKWIYAYVSEKKWVEYSLDHMGNTVYTHGLFLLAVIVGYVVLYRMVMFTYMKCKVCDIKMWHDLKKMKEDPEAQLSRKTEYKPVHNVDVVDGHKMIRTISSPLLVERDLAMIHTKHETRPLRSNTLRAAPPVPPTPPGMARKLSLGVIVTPDRLESAPLKKFASEGTI
ncbi:uncharacterized protein LOC115625648 [Scaptodrosophila lebanonensis]|uniref:Uncharacterized protein LOC115625648 n=1 Tax=Drosophila lebanonensis TaxID=7225 RepID=A0A6J2TIZ2_DROLE|nr:uncharacterized protein LOC115625648 [Scaptodrosophila lebanonensis]